MSSSGAARCSRAAPSRARASAPCAASGCQGGGEIVERCEAYDPAGRSLSYSIVGKSPVPIRNYFSTVKVIEQGPNACRVDWQGTFEPDGVPEEQAQAMVRGIYTGGIAGVRKLLGVA